MQLTKSIRSVLIGLCCGVGVLNINAEVLTFRGLKEQGVVSGFGETGGQPLDHLGKIASIDRPSYIAAKAANLPDDALCIGTPIDGEWRFSAIDSLNSREIVNHRDGAALCFCPLAGLSIAVPGKMKVSGLLRYDTFVLYDDASKRLMLPFDQKSLDGKDRLSLQPIQLLSYAGVKAHYPKARVLNPRSHRLTQPYGPYPVDERTGIGHPKPGLKKAFDRKGMGGMHPKDLVLLAGQGGKIQKGYPLSRLKSELSDGGHVIDMIDGRPVKVHYTPEHQWMRVIDDQGRLLNVGYAYLFAVVQNLPDLPFYE